MLLNKNFFRQAIAKIQLSIGIDGAFVVGLNTLGARSQGICSSRLATSSQTLGQNEMRNILGRANKIINLTVSKNILYKSS